MVELKKLGVMSVAKMYAITMAIFGFLIGIIYAIASLAGAQLEGLASFGFLGIIILPIVYAIVGFIAGLLGAWIYNMAAKTVGGVDLEFSGSQGKR